MRYWMDGNGFVTGADWSSCPDRWREVLPVVVGSKAWAAIQAMQFVKVGREGGVAAWRAADIIGLPQEMYLDGWHLLPTGPKRGDRVRWWRGEDSGTGRYECYSGSQGGDEILTHVVHIDGGCIGIAVERVEVIP